MVLTIINQNTVYCSPCDNQQDTATKATRLENNRGKHQYDNRDSRYKWTKRQISVITENTKRNSKTRRKFKKFLKKHKVTPED